MRTLPLLIVAFFVAVILPNEVGTIELPAVGAKKLAAKTDCRSQELSKVPAGAAFFWRPTPLAQQFCGGDAVPRLGIIAPSAARLPDLRLRI